MSADGKSIVLISDDAALGERIGAALRAAPGVSLTHCTATLAEMNGKARDLARSNDLIIFHAQPDTAQDVAALHTIREGGGTARLLALSDEMASVASARSLIQAGASDVVPDTLDAAELEELVTRLTAHRQLMVMPAQPRRGMVIAVAKARGGLGATTLAVNLADQLRGAKARPDRPEVALVDLDIQFGTVASFLDLGANQALLQLARDGVEPDATFVSQSLEHTASGLGVLAAPEGFMPLDALRPEQIGRLIEVLRTRHDYVVIDLPQAMVDWLAPVLQACDRMYLVADTSVPCVAQARRLIDFYRADNLALRIDVVIGGHKRPLFSSTLVKAAATALDQKFRYWLPPDPKHAQEAMDRGAPLSRTASGSGLSKAIAQIARDLASEGAAGQAHSKPARERN